MVKISQTTVTVNGVSTKQDLCDYNVHESNISQGANIGRYAHNYSGNGNTVATRFYKLTNWDINVYNSAHRANGNSIGVNTDFY